MDYSLTIWKPKFVSFPKIKAWTFEVGQLFCEFHSQASQWTCGMNILWGLQIVGNLGLNLEWNTKNVSAWSQVTKGTRGFFLEFPPWREGHLSIVVCPFQQTSKNIFEVKFNLNTWDCVHTHYVQWKRKHVLQLLYQRPYPLAIFLSFIVCLLVSFVRSCKP